MTLRHGLLTLMLALVWAGAGAVCARAGSPDADVRVSITCQVTPIDHYTVTGTSPQTRGIGWTETVRACDALGNTLAYSGVVVTLNSTGNAVFYTDGTYTVGTTTATLTNGVATIYVMDMTAETIRLSVVDGDGKTGMSGDIVVNEPAHIITAKARKGGSISPSGSVSVVHGADQTFTITANSKYALSDVLVDGVSVGAVTSYTFVNVEENHTITAYFKRTSRRGENLKLGGGGGGGGGGCALSSVPCSTADLLSWALPYLGFGAVWWLSWRRRRRRRRRQG